MTSIYEQSGGRNRLLSSGLALGRITAVDPAKRFCTVKTFFGEPGLIDLSLKKVQWLSTDANPEGDESTSIPRVGSTGLVFFVAGHPFIWGYFKAVDRVKGAVTGKEPSDLNEGDKVISTVGGNRIVVKASGVIEVHSKETLKTIYYPKDGLLSDICQAYQHKSDGGTISWKIIDRANNTLCKKEYRKDLARTSIVFEETGYVSATVTKRVSIGPGVPGIEGVVVPVYKMEQDVTGKTTVEIGLAGTGLNVEATPLGGFSMKNTLSGVTLSETGDWEITTPSGKISIDALGNIEASNQIASATLSAEGDIEVSNAIATQSISATGDILIDNGVATASMAVAGDIKVNNAIASFEATASGEMTLKNAVGTLKVDSAGKFGIGGPAAELLDLFDQTLDAFINQTQLTMTGTGPSSPLLPPAMTNLIKIKTLLTSIKGSV
jgi:hypothetical protein